MVPDGVVVASVWRTAWMLMAMASHRLLPFLTALAWLGGVASSAQASDLITVWQEAQQHDLDFAGAQASHLAGLAKKDQATALWRPTVQAQGTAGRMNSQTQIQGAQFSALPAFPVTTGANFNTSINNGSLQRWSVSARQPLLSRDRLAQGHELDKGAEIADLEFQNAQQALMLRVVQAYFDVLVGEEALQLAARQQQALSQALGEAQQRYRLGDIPVTDTHEAQARFEAVAAQVVAAESDLALKRQSLADMTGLTAQSLDLEMPLLDRLPGEDGALAEWIRESANNNYQLREQRLKVEVAREEAKRFSAMASPSVDLVGEVDSDHLTGSGDYGAASNTTRSTLVGIQLTIPLYTGGFRSSRHDETLRLADQAQTEAERLQQKIALATRSAWLGVTSGARRAQALALSVKASDDRLASTRVGHRVGDRSTLDLLNAESDAATLRLDWLQASLQVLENRLNLAALAGHLNEQDLQVLDGLMKQGNGTSSNTTHAEGGVSEPHHAAP